MSRYLVVPGHNNIVHIKLGEIHRLPQIEFYHGRGCILFALNRQSLKNVPRSNWFLSFNLTQMYLQLAMDNDNIKKIALGVGSTGLYEFTHIPFHLSCVGSSFHHMMEQCLVDWRLITLFLY